MMRRTFEPSGEEWFGQVAPAGIPVGESTVISGPGGSGKPLVGLSVVGAWLDAGGSVVVVLTNSGRAFVEETLAELYDIDVTAHEQRVAWVDFDPTLTPTPGTVTETDGVVQANLVHPDAWRTAIDRATAAVPDDGPGTLVFGAALNLLLFSPTYRTEVLGALVETAASTGETTRLLAVSTSAFEEEIEDLERAADTVLTTSTADDRLQLEGVRSESVTVTSDRVQVPFSPAELDRVKEIAEETRQTLIPTIRDI